MSRQTRPSTGLLLTAAGVLAAILARADSSIADDQVSLGKWLGRDGWGGAVTYITELELGRDGKAGGLIKMTPIDDEKIGGAVWGLKYRIEEWQKRAEPLFVEADKACPRWLKNSSVHDGRSASQICDLVTKRKEYWQRYIDACLIDAVNLPAKQLDSAIEAMAEAGLVQAADTDFYSQAKLDNPNVQVIVAATGAQIPVEANEIAERNRVRFHAAVAKVATEFRWSSKLKGSNAAFKAALLNRWKSDDVKLSVVKLGMFESGWNVVKNDLGYPTERKQLIGVLAKHPNEKFCRMYDLMIAQDHEGGGKYGKLQFYNNGFSRFLVSKCS